MIDNKIDTSCMRADEMLNFIQCIFHEFWLTWKGLEVKFLKLHWEKDMISQTWQDFRLLEEQIAKDKHSAPHTL